MAKKAETAPRMTEKALTRKERQEFVNQISEHIQGRGQELVLTPAWRQIEPYVELVGMMGILIGDQSLDGRRQAHIRKMISVQYYMTPQKSRAPRAKEFMQEVRNHAGAEIEEAQTLPEDMKRMPAAWRNAYADTLQMNADLNLRPEE
jgi:hypothetical protein